MTGPPAASRLAYSPQLRTALVLTGSGTAGAYHAGVLRAFQEAGVKVDLVAGTGMGAVSALFSAIDGGARLWSPDGLWRARAASRYYRVRAAIRIGAWALAGSLSVVLLPLLAMVAGLVVYPVAFLLRLLGAPSGGSLSRALHVTDRHAVRPRVPAVGSAARLRALARPGGRDARGAGGRRVRARLGQEARRGADLVAHHRRPAVARRSPPARCSTSLWQLVGGAAGARRPGPVGAQPRLHRVAARQHRAAGFPRAAADGPRPRHAARPGVRARRRSLPAGLLPRERGGRRRPSAGRGIRPGRRQPRPPGRRGPGRRDAAGGHRGRG